MVIGRGKIFNFCHRRFPYLEKAQSFASLEKIPFLSSSLPQAASRQESLLLYTFLLETKVPFPPPLSLQSLTNFAQKSLSGNCEERQRWPLLLFLAPQSYFRQSKKKRKIGKNEKFPLLQYSTFCGFPHTRERERRPMQTHTFVSGKRK